MRSIRLLFETQESAQEVAFMLRCEYDGCNMVTLPPGYDVAALKTAAALMASDFCFEGDHYPLVLPPLDTVSNEPVDPLRITHKAELWICSSPAWSLGFE
jgi:hypothetical protein